MNNELIPRRYTDAETTLPEVEQWCSAVLAGASARLILFGPVFSGKTHTAFAAVRRLLRAGYPASRIAIYTPDDLIDRDYDRARISHGPPVLVLDDITVATDLRHEVRHRDADEPEVQALMAVRAAALTDAVDALASRAEASWITCASTPERLAEAHGEQTASKLLAVADVVVLPARPHPGPL